MPTQTLRPDATPVAPTMAVAGASDAHTALSDNSDASYLEGDAGGEVVYVDFQTFTLPVGARVKRVQSRARTKLQTGGTNIFLLGAAGRAEPPAILGLTIIPLSGTVTTYTLGAYASDPDGGEWDQADLDELQFVAIHGDATGAGGSSRLYELFLDVLYQLQPTVTATDPAGSIETTTRPVLRHTYAQGTDGGPQERFRWKVFSQAQYTASGFNPETSAPVYDSGEILGSATAHTPTVDLPNGQNYRAYVKAAQSGPTSPHYSLWAFVAFTLAIPPPAQPTITATPDDVDGVVDLIINARDNLLTFQDSSLEDGAQGVGNWISDANCTLVRSTDDAASGQASLRMTAVAGGDMRARTFQGLEAYPVIVGDTYTALASFKATLTARDTRVLIRWYDAAGALLSTTTGATVPDITGAFTQVFATAVAPANAVWATPVPEVLAAGAGGGGGSPPTAAHLTTSGSNSAYVAPYTTASISPTANRLVVLDIAVAFTSSGSDCELAITGGGLSSWVLVDSVKVSTLKLLKYRGMSAAPGSGVITITKVSGSSPTSCSWSVSQFAGVETSGTNGSGAVRQSAAATKTTDDDLEIPLGAFGGTNNATQAAVADNTGGAITAGSGFTELGEFQGVVSIESEWKNSNDQTADATWASNYSRAAGIAIEIVAAGASGEGHLLDQISLAPGSSTVWSRGGPANRNRLTRNQSSYETDTTGWTPLLNCTTPRSIAQAAHGVASMAMTSVAAGDMAAITTPPAPCSPGLPVFELASFRAAVSARSCSIGVRFYDDAGAVVEDVPGAAVTDATGAFTQATAAPTVPEGATSYALIAAVLATGGAAEVHYVDKISHGLVNSSTWVPGDEALDHRVTVEISDDAGDTWRELRTDGVPVTQKLALEDHTAPYGLERLYRAVTSIINPNGVTSASEPSAEDGATLAATATWRLKDPSDASLTIVKLPVIGSHDISIDERAGEFTMLNDDDAGEELPVVITDSVTGEDGRITVLTRSHADWTALKALITAQRTLLLVSPFGPGEQWFIRITKRRDVKLTGTPQVPRRVTTLDYVEVDPP